MKEKFLKIHFINHVTKKIEKLLYKRDLVKVAAL